MGSSISSMSEPAVWHIIASEYPPQRGGVSDYTHVVAQALVAAGDEVHVWCPPASRVTAQVPGIAVHRALGALGRSDLARLDQLLDPLCPLRRVAGNIEMHSSSSLGRWTWICSVP